METRGFQIVEEGQWEDVIAFCRTLSEVLKDHVSDRTYTRFEGWRPKTEESKRQLREKTAEEAAIHKTKIEEDSAGTVQELSSAGGEMKQSGKDMVRGDPRRSLQDAEKAGNSAVRGFFPPLIRLFRIIEESIYANIMGKTSPDYFECDDFTLALERAFLHRDTYRVRLICNDSDLMETVAGALEEEA